MSASYSGFGFDISAPVACFLEVLSSHVCYWRSFIGRNEVLQEGEDGEWVDIIWSVPNNIFSAYGLAPLFWDPVQHSTVQQYEMTSLWADLNVGSSKSSGYKDNQDAFQPLRCCDRETHWSKDFTSWSSVRPEGRKSRVLWGPKEGSL